MKRLLCFCAVLMVMLLCGELRCSAAAEDVFDDDVRQIEASVDDQTAAALQSLRAGSVSQITTDGVNAGEIFSYLLRQTASEGKEPLAAVTLMIPVLIFCAVGESYTFSLRYAETKEIMGTMVSLFAASILVSPLTGLIAAAVTVIKGTSALMTVYLPVMAGILLFSGHAVASGGYYAAVVLVPLLNLFLALSVSTGIAPSLRIGGLVQSCGKLFKTCITFAMTIFIAVIGLNSALSSAADSVANKAARFSLSSFIPLIGSSIAEAYGAIQGGVNILRSGVGVFVILAVFVSFAPLLLRVMLWSLAVFAAQTVGEALSVSSAQYVLQALTAFLSSLRALLIAVMTVFIIASAVMMTVGGGS